MKLLEVKCPNCNASLKVDKTNKKVTCDYCGTNFILDDNVIKVKHMMVGQITEEQEFVNAETNLNKLKDYSASYNGYLSLSKRYVNNEEVWIGLLRSLTHDFSYKYESIDFKKEYQKYWNNFIALAPEEEKQKYYTKYKNYVDNVKVSNEVKGNVKKENNYILVTIFGGWFGIHKFMQNQVGLGFLYLVTGGLFGIGWIIDIINECRKHPNSKAISILKYILVGFCFLFAITELKYSIWSFIVFVICGISITNFFWKKININNKTIKVIVPFILFFIGIELGSDVVPTSLYGTWTPLSMDSPIDKVILQEEDNKLYINNNEILCGTSDYYKEVIYLETETSNEYRFKYNETENTICLLDDSDECQYKYVR